MLYYRSFKKPPLSSSKARLFASLFEPVFEEVESDWLGGSPAHFLDADWLVAESGLAASLPSPDPWGYAWVCLYEIGRGDQPC